MKTIILFILFTLLNNPSLGQSLVDSLTSDDHDIIFNKLDEIVDQNRVAAIPIIHNIIEQSDPYVQLQFLHTLDALNDQEIRGYTHNLIDRADQFALHESPEDPLFAKVDASGILFKYDDFSTAEYLIEYIELKKPNILWFIDLLPLVYQNVPAYRQVIKDDLVNILENAQYETIRFIALEHLIEFAGTEAITNIVNAFVNNSKSSIRLLAFEGLIKLNYQELNSLFKTRLSLDSDEVIRSLIADTLLIKFGAPSDLKVVIDYQPNEPDETTKSLMEYSINHFIPPKPDKMNWNGLATKLITYTDEMLQYGWIANQQTKDFYTTKLQDIITLINQTNEIDSACIIINTVLLPQVEQDLQEKLITTEGNKFLHYYTIYIKEEIEEELGHCQ